jgi:hypothetical protein
LARIERRLPLATYNTISHAASYDCVNWTYDERLRKNTFQLSSYDMGDCMGELYTVFELSLVGRFGQQTHRHTSFSYFRPLRESS